jgi:hypothetical protein
MMTSRVLTQYGHLLEEHVYEGEGEGEEKEEGRS